MPKGRYLAAATSVISAAVLGVGGAASDAGAATWTSTHTVNNCDYACVVIFYNSQYGGSRTTFENNKAEEGIPNLGPYTFKTVGAGQGLSVKNHAASAQARNYGLGYNVTIYRNSGYAGPCDRLQAGHEYTYASKLANTYNDDASLYWRDRVQSQGCKYWS